MLTLPPLSLYIHIPWCVRKCPYCDFNSHAAKGELPQQAYMEALLADLEQDLHYVQGRELVSIFIGGGTPSLIEPHWLGWLLEKIKALIPFAADIEITMEANPGTVEAQRFALFKQAGINRLSVGVQSFDDDKLSRLGRVHNSAQAQTAVQAALTMGFNSVNLDLMFGLPEQSVAQAMSDLKTAIALGTPHLSWYQLTLEPNTAFYSQPPALPDDDLLWEMVEQGGARLRSAGYEQYEVSAWAKPGYRCRHNLNYWRFGDYLGIGCGAHGKITLPERNEIVRTVKVKHPRGYLDNARAYLESATQVEPDARLFEYFLNRFRLFEPVPKAEFCALTGLTSDAVAEQMRWGKERQLLIETDNSWQLTESGQRYLNSFLEQFIDEQ